MTQKRIIWTQNGLDRTFLGHGVLTKWVKKCSNLLIYAKLAKTNEAFSRKGRKTAKNPYFGDKMPNNLDTHFFFKNRASSLSTFVTG